MSFRKGIMRGKTTEYSQDTQFGVMHEWYDENDASQNRFFLDHWLKVKHARNFPNRETKIEHELIGKKVIIDEEELLVQSIHKMWYLGYYLVILYVTPSESHGTFVFQNINSHDPSILEEIEKNKQRIKI